ncbi:hypothetical protein CU098_002707, partial [Rhizopus stolonifer]
KLTLVDYSNISANFAKIKKKWKLKSGKMVEDIMFEASKDFIVEHPAHSLILNVMDPVWKECFSQSEFDEIKSEENIFKFNKPFPCDLQEVILKLDKKTGFRDMYDAIDAVKAHPLDDCEKFWLKQSVLDYLMLFSDDDTLASSETEKDLLGDVYGFVKKSCKLSGTKTHGAKLSRASSVSKNADRTIGSSSTVQRKHAAENADLTFRHFSHELCCLEIGLNDFGPNDTKEMNESSIKTPIMMKNFCAHLVSQYKTEPKNIKIMGIIISGLNIKALGMSFNNGSVSLLSTSDRLHMPESVSEIPRLLPPALRLVYNLNKFLNAVAYHASQTFVRVYAEKCREFYESNQGDVLLLKAIHNRSSVINTQQPQKQIKQEKQSAELEALYEASSLGRVDYTSIASTSSVSIPIIVITLTDNQGSTTASLHVESTTNVLYNTDTNGVNKEKLPVTEGEED